MYKFKFPKGLFTMIRCWQIDFRMPCTVYLHQCLLVLLLLGISHRSSYGVRARDVFPLYVKVVYLIVHWTVLTHRQFPVLQVLKPSLNWLRSRWVYSKSNTQFALLIVSPDVKGSPRIEKSYLLRLHCSKPIARDTVSLFAAPRNSSWQMSYRTSSNHG